jgi:hypothetical protein
MRNRGREGEREKEREREKYTFFHLWAARKVYILCRYKHSAVKTEREATRTERASAFAYPRDVHRLPATRGQGLSSSSLAYQQTLEPVDIHILPTLNFAIRENSREKSFFASSQVSIAASLHFFHGISFIPRCEYDVRSYQVFNIMCYYF